MTKSETKYMDSPQCEKCGMDTLRGMDVCSICREKDKTPTPATAQDCKAHTEYGRHKSDSQCVYAENEQPNTQNFEIFDNPLHSHAFIVRAVNSHEELLEALKAALHELELDLAVSKNPIPMIKQAIAKAEGK